MKFGPYIFQDLSRQKIIKYLVEDEVIMSWNVLKKSILILGLGAAIHVVWIIWKLFVLSMPHLMQWVNVPLMQTQLKFNIVFLCAHLALIYPCIRYKNSESAQKILPFVTVAVLVVSLLRDGYSVGVFSPATMIGYVSLVAVGCVLLPRVIVYSAFIPATLFLIGCAYLSFLGPLPYGPLFNLGHDIFHQNSFWLLSMAFFISPILITCMLLFEVLLSQWRHRENLIHRLSEIDPLTNLYNRRSINEALLDLDHRMTSDYAVVLLDLDHFKNINDRYGHDKGDETLVKVSNVLKNELRDSDVVGRFGGEEFILLLKKSSLEQAQQIAERCRSKIESLTLTNEYSEPIPITASFGIAISQPNMRPQQLLSQADQALYKAKAAGRNRVMCYGT
jgi:diguanylate cyclase (GGDEF)-like protein